MIENQAEANFQGNICISVGDLGGCGPELSGVISSNNNFVCPCQVEFTTAQGSSIQRYSFAGTINASGSEISGSLSASYHLINSDIVVNYEGPMVFLRWGVGGIRRE